LKYKKNPTNNKKLKLLKLKKKNEIVMVKIIIQKNNKNTRFRNNKKFSLFCKSSGIIP
jgi:hypothetical protein